MTDKKASIRPSFRRESIRDHVDRHGSATIDELATKFNTSAETIRRDLKQLADAGQVRKIHGGANRIEVSKEGPFDARMVQNLSAKQRLAEKLRPLVLPGQSIFIDTGSTTLIGAQLLTKIKNLRVVTNSVLIADLFANGQGKADVTLLGGIFRSDNRQTVGAETVRQVRDFQLDHAILTIAAIDELGILDIDEEEAQVARAMIASSRILTVVADASKMQIKGQYRLCPLRRITNLVLDGAPLPPLAQALRDADVKLF